MAVRLVICQHLKDVHALVDVDVLDVEVDATVPLLHVVTADCVPDQCNSVNMLTCMYAKLLFFLERRQSHVCVCKISSVVLLIAKSSSISPAR